MKALTEFLQKSKQNKLFVIAVIGICLGVIEFTTHFFSTIPMKMNAGSGAQVVAVVQTVQTDVRQKPVEENAWYRAEPQTEIMRGDAVYSGHQSRSQVQMKSGGILELGEDTMVIFDDVDGVTIPDVARGQVKLKVTGQMKIAISGEVTEFSGAQSELLLNADGTTRNVRVMKGETSVSRKGVVARSLVTGQVLDLPALKTDAPKLPKIEIPKAGDLISEVKISEKRKTVEATPLELKPVKFAEVEATPVPAPVATPIPVVHAPEPTAAPLPVVMPPPVAEAATAPVVPEPMMVKEALAAEAPEMKVDRIMKVQEVYQRQGQRALIPRVGLKTLKVPVALSWHGTKPDDKVIVQVSKEKTFAQPWIEKEATGPNVVIEDWKPGRNYWRVSRDRQTWSEPAEVVVKPTVAVAQAPTVAVLNSKVAVHEKGKGPVSEAKLRFADSGLAKPRGWVLQGSSSSEFNPKKTRTVYVKEPRVDIPLTKPGRYFFRVRSVASAGEISSFSGPVEVQATKAVAPPVELAPRLAKNETKKNRKVAAVEEKNEDEKQAESAARNTSKLKTAVEAPDNRIRPWSVAIEGGETALVSSEQINQSTDPASLHVIGLRGKYENERNSFTSAYRSKFGGANSEGNAQSSSRLEFQYTRWWQTKWAPLRLGWASALERYRNPSTTRFSKGYDAAKTGLNVGIKIADRWKTGGDIMIGTWTDSNRVYEFGGFLSYDISRELAFGVGYRLSLFDAAVEGSAPVPLPYREAMGEAYSSLQFSF